MHKAQAMKRGAFGVRDGDLIGWTWYIHVAYGRKKKKKKKKGIALRRRTFQDFISQQELRARNGGLIDTMLVRIPQPR